MATWCSSRSRRSAEALYRRTDELAPVLAHAITRDVRLSDTTPVPFEVIVSGCTGTFADLQRDCRRFDVRPTAAAELGIQRAEDVVPLTSLMEAYRVGFRCVWDAVMTESAMHNHVNGEALRVLTAKVSAAQDIYTDAMAVAYRAEQARRVLGDESERSVLIDSVPARRLLEQWSVWEAADYLRLPSSGPYVVVAAETRRDGHEALPKSIDVASMDCAPRGDASRSAGRDRARQDRQTPRERLGAVSRITTTRYGVSSSSTTCVDGQALRYAELPCAAGRTRLRGPFDGSILATAR